jgi:hypothetical protein
MILIVHVHQFQPIIKFYNILNSRINDQFVSTSYSITIFFSLSIGHWQKCLEGYMQLDCILQVCKTLSLCVCVWGGGGGGYKPSPARSIQGLWFYQN